MMAFHGQRHSHRQKSELPQKAENPVKHSSNNTASSEILFTSDRQGDEQNVQYGSLDKNKIPRYRTSGYGRLLGLDRRYRIVSASNASREVNDDANDTTRRGRDMPSLVANRPLEDIEGGNNMDLAVAEDLDFPTQQDFISLGSKQSRKRRKLASSRTDQKALQEPLLVRDSDSSDSIINSDSDFERQPLEPRESDAFDQFRNHPDNKQQIELLRKTDQDPESVEAWLALINHQDSFYLLSLPNDAKFLTSSAKRTIADIKISLFERALKAVHNIRARERLLLGYLREGSRLWDTKKQLDEWRVALRQTSSLSLWYQFLDFQQSNAMTFTYDNCSETYAQVLQHALSLADPEDHDYQLAYTVLRQTTFMHQAGFSERAIAIWQALIEYNFFRPSSANTAEPHAAFEVFWNSEVARVGEENAKGWSAEAEQEIKQQADPPLPQYRDLETWAKAEMARSDSEIMPARTLDDTIEDDPYRVIIASDIKSFLISLKSTRGRKVLIEAFLKFCGLPQANRYLTECRSWWCDPFLSDYHSGAGVVDSSNSLRTNVMSHFVADTSTILPSSDWFSAWHEKVSATKIAEFAINVLTQLVYVQFQNQYLAEYAIALMTYHKHGSARKLAKALLKKRSDSLILYNAYALTEISSKKFEMAKNVWSTALSMASSFSAEIQRQSILLWHSQIWDLLKNGRKDEVLRILVETMHDYKPEAQPKLARVREYSSGEILKTEILLRNRVADSMEAREFTVLAACTDVLATFKYLASDYDINEIFPIYRSSILAIPIDGNITVELLHQYQARLIHYHGTHSPSGYRPTQLISHLRVSYQAFPENAIIHNVYYHYSRQAGAMDRLRDLDITTVSPSTPSASTTTSVRNDDRRGENYHHIASIVPSLLKIDRELNRPIYAGSTAHSIRSAFSQATSSPDGPALHSPQTWLSWLNWELSSQLPFSFHSTNPPKKSSLPSSSSSSSSTAATAPSLKRIKETYLSSLRACPWCKELYLVGFQHQPLREAIGPKGLVEIYRGMVERGLRVRIDISEEIEDLEMLE